MAVMLTLAVEAAADHQLLGGRMNLVHCPPDDYPKERM
jgi:hypothetical protein